MTCSIDKCNAASKSRGMCGRHYQRWYTHGDPLYEAPLVTLAVRFGRHVESMEPGACWIWTGALTADGYGILDAPEVPTRVAHRAALYLSDRWPVPPGREPDHLCRNRACVNPAHIAVITLTENRRRSANARLTVAKSDEIRELYASGSMTQRALAKQFAVSQGTISAVVTNKTWN